ncbi:MAG: hypothetical protein WCW47_00075 [Candidatus Paceibacterota bacterium]|jgi:hypothetical protein
MKTLIALLVVLIASATIVNAQTTTGFVEGQFQMSKDATVAKTLDVALTHPIKPGWAIEGWALKTDGWGEAYVGVSKLLTSWASLTAQVGVEEADRPWRVAGTLWMGNAKFSALVILEEGGSGWWHKVVVTGPAIKHAHGGNVKAGILSQRFVGTGPYMELSFGKASFWVTIPVVNGNGALAGIRMGF